MIEFMLLESPSSPRLSAYMPHSSAGANFDRHLSGSRIETGTNHAFDTIRKEAVVLLNHPNCRPKCQICVEGIFDRSRRPHGRSANHVRYSPIAGAKQNRHPNGQFVVVFFAEQFLQPFGNDLRIMIGRFLSTLIDHV